LREKSIHDIKMPNGISEQMIQVAKFYVQNKLKVGFTKEGMFKHFKMSSKTWYKWLENEPYQKYINEMESVLIPEDELEAVRKMKKKIMAYADKTSVSVNEMKMFADVFSYIFEADARLQSEKLGLTESNPGINSHMSLEEKREVLIGRLTGNKGDKTDE
jgi:hypothetical protein